MVTTINYDVDFCSYLKYDPKSPTGLTWKVDIFSGRDNVRLSAHKNQPAGSFISRPDGTRHCIVVGLNGKVYRAHRIVYKLVNGILDSGRVIDHLNGDPWDNRIENLALKTKKANSQNKKLRADNSSGTTGVSWSSSKYSTRAYAFVEGRDKEVSKSFAVNKYGLLPAFKLAFLWRQAQIKLLNESGEDYTDRHGKVGSMKIKILKCSDTSLWYSTKLRETLIVYRVEPTLYWCREDDEYGCLNFVYKNDCIVVD